MFSFLSSDSDGEYSNNDDGESGAEPISSPPLSTSVNSSQLSSVTKRKFTSDVWNYFSIKADKAICKCGRIFAYKTDGSTGTSSLKRHLLECKAKTLKIDESQSGIVYDSFSKSYLSTSLTFDQTRSAKALVELIVANDLPFVFAEYSGLNVFVKGLNSDFKLCTAKTVKSNMMKYYSNAKKIVQQLISKPTNSMFSATTDLWTSEHQNIGYICVTLHWIDANFELIHLLIGFEEMIQPHSGANLVVAINKIFKEWSIEPYRILRIVMDNASNNSRCIEEMKRMVLTENKSYMGTGSYLQGHCAAHVVNLIANVAIQSLELSTI